MNIWLIIGVVVFFIAWGVGLIFTQPSAWHINIMIIFAFIFVLFALFIGMFKGF